MGLDALFDLSFGQCFLLWIATTLVVTLMAGAGGLLLERGYLDVDEGWKLRCGLLLQGAFLLSSCIFAIWLPLARIQEDASLSNIAWVPAMAAGGVVGMFVPFEYLLFPGEEALLLRLQAEAARHSQWWLVPVGSVPFLGLMGVLTLSNGFTGEVVGEHALIAAFGGLAHVAAIGVGARSFVAWRALRQACHRSRVQNA